MTNVLILAAWLLCGLGGVGFLVAYLAGKFPAIAKEEYREDLGFGLFLGVIGGPAFLVISYLVTGFGKYGWRLLL